MTLTRAQSDCASFLIAQFASDINLSYNLILYFVHVQNVNYGPFNMLICNSVPSI